MNERKMREEPRARWVFILVSIIIIIISLYLSNGSCDSVAMRIVDEPNMMGFNNIFTHPSKLIPKVKPMELSGPPHLFHLAGRCWALTIGIYTYELCPFHNATQHEQTIRWNAYSGILGVWQGWDISNFTFVAMLMKEGDSCGSRNREVQVSFICGEANKLLRVAEPATCSYTMEFSSPLVCHPHALLVYPTLHESLRNEWDQLEQALYDSVINKQNYTKSLNDLFERAGLAQRPLIESGNPMEFRILETCNQSDKHLSVQVRANHHRIIRLTGLSHHTFVATHGTGHKSQRRSISCS
uniref:N-acetylglucosamine-1-phosphotransferase subunit gamma isoform X2 n=1 Tax=Myxine glutinosa TaxID=7769 RepID=UPI00358FD664